MLQLAEPELSAASGRDARRGSIPKAAAGGTRCRTPIAMQAQTLPEAFCWGLTLLPPCEETQSLAGITPGQEKFSSSLFCRCNLLQQKAITANGFKALPPQLDLPCHVPLTSNSALIPALKYIMKDIQNISKWHWY